MENSRLILILPLLFLIPILSCEDQNVSITPIISASDLDEVVLDEMARQHILGMAVAVVQNGEIVHTKAYGHLNKDRTVPVSTSSMFHWASISKTVTAIATMRAVTDGHMQLDDKVKDHVSYWPSSGDKDDITIDHLLSNRSGITHYGRDENDNSICSPDYHAYKANNNWNAEQSVDVFKDCPLLSPPNTVYRYSTFGFNLLGAAVEEATGTAYETYVDQKIANVAGMSSFTPYPNAEDGFSFDCNRAVVKTAEGDTEYKLPGGGWGSDIGDLALFLKGLVNNEFIPLTGALWIEVPGNDIYRKGIFYEYLNGKLHVYHGGDNSSVTTYMGFFPGDKNGVCFMTNANSYINKNDLAKKIENLMGYNWSTSDLPVDECGDDDDCGNKVVGVWRNTGEAENTLIRRQLGNDAFNKEWSFMLDAGYYLEDLETYLKGTVRKWDGIFKKGDPGSALWRGFTDDDWLDKYIEMRDDGYRLIDLETYKDGTVRKWAGTFVKSSDKSAMYRGLSKDEFGDKHAELKDQNYKLIDVETYLTGTVRKWAGVWKGEGTALLNRGYGEDDFKDLRVERENAGYKLIDVETYKDGTVRKWAGVWEAADGDERFRLDRKMCELLNQFHNDYKKDGYEILDLEKY